MTATTTSGRSVRRTRRYGEPAACHEFVQVAHGGFGDAYNGIAHSMAYFDDHVFVGTSRCNLHMISVNHNAPSTWIPPVKCPADVYELDRRAQIWRWGPNGGGWERVYTSPATPAENGTTIPNDIGYRSQAVFQGVSDRCPALYVCTWSPSRWRGPTQLLRSSDGQTFERVGRLGSGDQRHNTFRTLLPFNGRLYTSPTGMTSGYGQATECMVDAPVIYETRDPAKQPWRPVSTAGFGDPGNLTVFEMREFAGHLYAGTLNAVTGYQIWRTDATGRRPYRWVKVVDGGAGRGNLNEIPVSMCVFRDALYVGSGIQNGGRDRVPKIGPAGAELIRIHPDGSWDLIVGDPRDTPDGRKRPLSGLGPGFGSTLNALFWSMAEHDGELYLGTYNWAVFMPYFSQRNWPERLRQRLNSIGVDAIVRERGGCDLWRSHDGVHWVPVTTHGFGNPFNYGIRTLLPTPHGLFVGTANAFGPEVAVRRADGWRYERNPHGGTEVWVRPAGTTSAADGAQAGTTVARLRARYDEQMFHPLVEEYYGGSGFYNWGYWRPETASQREASRNLMDMLLARVPDRTGTILDVACGKGATTRYLLRYYHPSQVVGVDISGKLLHTARSRAPGCRMVVGDATRLPLADGSVRTVLSVDGAALFDTRAAFFAEAYRVLAPGGSLVMSDRLLTWRAVRRFGGYHRDNYVHDLEEYRQTVESAGFTDVDVQDATEPCLRGYVEAFLAFARRKRAAGDIDADTLDALTSYLLSRLAIVRNYVLLTAAKPSVPGRPATHPAGVRAGEPAREDS